MDRKKIYWIIGIVVLILIVIILWFAIAQDSKIKPLDETQNKQESETDQGNMDHTNHMASNNDENSSDQDLTVYLKEQDTIMADMMKGMAGIGESGNASIDFLKGMIPHHESAVDMANSYLNNGASNKELMQLAQDIIEAQTVEIEQMNTMIQEIGKEGKKDAKKEAAYLKEYNQMFAGHHAGHGVSTAAPGSVEEAFAEGMIEHHQMAVDMAKSILNYTDVESVKSLSENIVKTQEKEIADMQEILKNLKAQ